MAIRKRGTGYQVRVDPFPTQTVPRKRDAERLEMDLKTKKALGHLHVAEPITFGRSLDDLYARKSTVGGKRGKLRPKSLKWMRESLAPWEPLRDTLVPSLRRKKMEDLVLAVASTRPVTAKNMLQVGKSALRLAESRGQTVDKAIFSIEPVSHEAAEGRALTPDEVNAIAAYMPERLKRLVLLTGTIGFRWAEAMKLSEDWIDLRAATITVPREDNKSRRIKRIPLSASEVELIREQLEITTAPPLLFPTLGGKVYSSTGFRKVWLPALLQAGFAHRGVDKHGEPKIVADFTFHWLRHTAISLMAKAGMRPELIAERVGHSDGGALILRRYRHLYPAEGLSAVALVDGLLDAKETM